MDKTAPEILQLRLDIEHNLGKKIRTPYDFEFLAGVIWERIHQNISPTTLKRLWGYIDGADTARRSTLGILSSFLGYCDWEDYIGMLQKRSDVESYNFVGEGVQVADLSLGARVEVTWLPNRRCVFVYEGESHFVVEEAQHAKLHKGDRFMCSFFYVNQPLYIDNLIQRESPEPISYVAGSKSGLISVRVL